MTTMKTNTNLTKHKHKYNNNSNINKMTHAKQMKTKKHEKQNETVNITY